MGHTMSGRSVIVESEQVWKVVLGLALLIGGGATNLAVSFIPYLRELTEGLQIFYSIRAVSTAAAAVGFVYLCLSVRCPRCGAKWIWMAATGKFGPGSLDALITLDRCPTCGYPGGPSSEED